MSVIATRAPLEIIGMNSLTGSQQIRGDSHAPVDNQQRHEEASTRPETTINKPAKRKKDYDQESDGFVFTKNKRAKPSSRLATEEVEEIPTTRMPTPRSMEDEAQPVKKIRKRLPTTPELDGRTIRSRQTTAQASPSRQKTASPHKAAHAQSHHNTDKQPSPVKPLTVEKKRRKPNDDDRRTSRIVLSTADTPVIRRNRAMRQSVANNDRRRSSSGMRGRRASIMLDGGNWSGQPHSEVQTSEFYTMISPDLIEPRRMRLLLGWCGDRALPSKPQAPSSNTKEASEEFQATQAARIIAEELSKELKSNESMSSWFSREDEEPQSAIILRKRPNPRNVTNAAKVEELHKELTRLKAEKAAWDKLITEAAAQPDTIGDPDAASLSPPRLELLSPSQQDILQQLQQEPPEPDAIQQQLDEVASGLEFVVDQLSHNVHTIATAKETTMSLANKTMQDTARAAQERELELASRVTGPRADPVDALRGLARILNSRK